MRVDHRSPSRALLCLVAAVALSCGGDSPTRSSPIGKEPLPAAIADPLSLDLSPLDRDAPELDQEQFEDAREILGSSAAFTAGSGGWELKVVRAPKTGQSFRVERATGEKPQPNPKFKLSATTPLNMPEAAVLLVFLSSGGKECGLATTRSLTSFTAGSARTIDIPNDYIVAGPLSCILDGQKCSDAQCKFPLTTTKVKVLYGHRSQGVAQATITAKYTWTVAPKGGGGGGGGGGDPSPDPGPNPTPTPDPGGGGGGGGGGSNNCPAGSTPGSAPCGTPTAKCDDGTYSCSQNASGTCSSHGGVDCWICPGPLCH